MNISRLINVVSIFVGGLVALYAQAQSKQNTYLLMGGLVLLMFGIYRTSRTIPSKNDSEKEDTYIKTEDDN
jgi:hypothetical protein